MKKPIYLFLLCLFCNLSFSQKHQDRFDAIDVQHYRFEIQLNDESNKISGIAQITIRFKKSLNSFDLDLINQDGDGTGMKIIALMEGTSKVPFEHIGNKIKIKSTAQTNDLKTYTLAYEGIPKTGLIISKNKFGDRTFFGDNYPDRGQHWLPIVDHPSDKATVEWVVTAPSHYQIVGNGKLIEHTNINESTTLTHWKTDVALPTKVMVIGAARFAIQNVADVYGTTVSSWIYPQDREKGFYDYAPAAPILDWFINHVGDYPFAKLANVQSKTQFGGMENAGNIFYFENSVTGERKIEELLAHEIAHQWFGNSASEGNWHHAWLSEGFATYFTILYVEQRHGRAKAWETVLKNRQQVIDFSKKNRVPIVNTAIENYMEILNDNTYQKGGWVLHMLRKEVGDEIFWEAIRQYYDKYKLSNALTDDLKDVFELVSGKNLDVFFQQWVYQAGQPNIDASWNFKNGQLDLEILQKQPENFVFDLELEVAYADGTSERRVVKVESKKQSYKPKLKSAPVKVTLDPDAWLLFEGGVIKK
uniref:M1 family metallopeptidase n=2 Tax=Roseivirga sp. TaxID=1964215 RepID=UPI004047F296